MYPSPDPLLPIAIVAIVFGTLLVLSVTAIVVPTLAYHRRTVRTRELARELILAMLQQGKSVAEIEQVLAAWSRATGAPRRLWRGFAAEPTAPAREMKRGLPPVEPAPLPR